MLRVRGDLLCSLETRMCFLRLLVHRGLRLIPCRSTPIIMNFYFEAVGVLDKLDAKKGSIKGVLASVPEKNRKRTAALVIETLKCEAVQWISL